MNPKFRLTRSTDFKRVRRFGKSYAHPLIVLIAMVGETGKTRCGIAAGRSVGNAVRRNRAKRLLREALRPVILDIPPGWNILLIARESAPRASLQELRTALRTLLHRARLVSFSNED